MAYVRLNEAAIARRGAAKGKLLPPREMRSVYNTGSERAPIGV